MKISILPLIAVILIIAGFLLIFYFLSQLANEINISGAFVITIFFIPIAGSFGEYGNFLLALLILLTIALIFVNFIIFLRKRF